VFFFFFLENECHAFTNLYCNSTHTIELEGLPKTSASSSKRRSNSVE